VRCEHLHDSGSYVLGALSPPERDAYERHLDECEICRDEVAEVAVLPGLLSRLDAATAQAIAAGGEAAMDAVVDALPGVDGNDRWAGPTAVPMTPMDWAGPTVVPDTDDGEKRDPLLPRVLDRVNAKRRADRRRRRWQTAASALVAACLAVFAVFAVQSVRAPDFAEMQKVVAAAPLTARVALEAFEGGTRVRMQCEYKRPDGADGLWTFRLFAIPKMGDPQELNSWSAGDGDEYNLIGHTTLKPTEIKRLEVRGGTSGSTLLAYDVT
jgi:hypothetical protein